MKKHLSMLMLLAALIVPWVTQAQGTAISTFPWSCNFETADDNAAWTFVNATNGWYIGTATHNGGTHSLYVSENNGTANSYSGEACVSYAYVTVDIANPGQYAVQFDWKCGGESTYDFLRVAVAPSTTALPTSYSDWTSTAVPSGFVAIDGGSKLNLAGTAWTTQNGVVSVPSAGTYRLIFVWRNDGSVYNQPPAAVDNVQIAMLSCPQPTSLYVSSITTDGALLTWSAGGTETSWEVQIGEDTYYTSDTSYTFTNLDGNTPYVARVRAICGTDDTSFYSSIAFRTACVAISQLPYFNDFENEPHYLSGTTTYAEAFPNCWTRINDASGTYNYYPYINTSSTYLIHGTKSMYWYHTTTTTYADNEYAVLPPVDLSAYSISDLTFTFWAKTTATAAPWPLFIVGVLTNPTDASTFEPVDTITLTTTATLYAVSLANYSGNGNYIAIRCPRTSSARYCSLDDVYLTDDWCDIPEQVTASSTSDEVTLTWDANGGSSFTVFCGLDTITGVSDTSYTFTGLTANTPYAYGVATECSSSLSSFITGSIRTQCMALTELPYSNDFEDEPYYLSGTTTYAEAFPNCWTRINDATGTYNYYPYINTTTSYVHSGTKGMYWYQTSTSGYAQNEFAVLPPVDPDYITVSDLILSFYAKTTSTSYHPAPVVGVMTDPTDASTFVPVYTFTSTEITTNWTLYTIQFSNYTGTGTYVAIKWANPGSTCYMAIDDIYLTNEWCDNPLNVTASSTTEEVTLSWNTNGGTSFTVILGEDTVSGVTDSVYTFTDLTPNTPYTYGVFTECSSSSSFVITGAIRTLCIPIDSLPYSYGFEDLATGSSSVRPVITCWHHLNNGTQYFGYPYVSSTTPHSGSRNLYWYNTTTTGTYGDYMYVVLPGVDPDIYPINTLQLNFWARPSSTSYSPVFQVGVMTNPNDHSTFQQVAVVNVASSTEWQEFTIPLGSYTGTGIYVAVRTLRASSSWYAYTDDFTLEPMPSCPTVVSHNVTATAGAARITWTPDPNFGFVPDGYEVSYGYASDSLSVSTTVNLTTPELVLTGLDADTGYMVSISPVCEGVAGVANVFDFSTRALPCLEWDTAGGGPSSPEATYIVGTPGTSTTNVMPVNSGYNYSYCNHLILRSDISTVPQGTTYFSGIDFQFAGTTPMVSKTNCTIYMCHTTMTVCDNFANPADLVLVYEGPLNCVNGWNHFDFNRGTFAYNGTSNIIVAIVDNSGAYNSNDIFYYESIGTSRSHRVYRNDAPYTFAELGTVTAGNSVWRSNMRLTTGGNGGGSCLTQATCAAPAVSIEQNADGDYELSWIPGYQETSWDVDYRAASSTTWNNVLSSTSLTSYVFSTDDLLPNTQYEFRVMANCTDSNYATTVEFTTPCAPFPVPFSTDFENFSSTAADPLPNCWSKHTNYTTNYPYASTSYHLSGSKAMYMYSTSTTYSYMVLPQFALPIDSTMLSFWLYKSNTSYAHNIQVGVMTDPEDLNTFTMVADVAPQVVSQWEQFEVSLASYQGNGRYIALLSPNNVYSYPYLDDLEVSRLSSCSRVSNLRTTNVLTTSATINWYDTNSSNNTWYVEYDTVEFIPGTNHMSPISVTDSTYTITGLDSGTVYYVYVYPDCDEVSARSMRFTTLAAAPAVVPYFCDFENPGVNGWDLINGNEANYWIVGNATANGGTRSLYVTNDGSTNTYNGAASYVFATRSFSLVDTGEYAYSFDWKAQGESSFDFIRAALVPAGTEIEAGGYCGFNNAEAPSGTMPAGGIALDGGGRLNLQGSIWQNQRGTFYITQPGTYKWVIMWRNDGSVYNNPPAAIDNVGLQLNTCNMVQNVSVTATDNSVNATWTAGGLETEWEVEFDGVATVVYTPTFSATGLNSNTLYSIAIRAICSSVDTGMAYVESIRTACAVESLPYFEDFESYTSGSTNPISPCWVKNVIGTTTQYPYPYSTNAISGNISLYFYSYHPSSASTTPYHCYAALPLFNAPVDSLEISFKMRRYSTVSDYYTSIIVVGVMTNPNDITTFTAVDTIDLHSEPSLSIHDISVPLNSYTGTGNYIALYSPVPPLYGSGTYSYSYTYIDDVAVSYASPCPRAYNLQAYNGTATSVTLEWTDTIGSSSWVIEYGQLGDSNTTTVTVTSNPYTLTGLTPNTNYRYHVAPMCSTGQQADWSLRWHNFCTALNPATVPYSYDFEAAAEWNNWQTNSNNTINWYRGNVAHGNTTNTLYLSADGGVTHSWNMNTVTNAVAYRDIDFGTDTHSFQVDFDVYVGGTTSANYDGVAIVVTDPAYYVEASNSGIVSPWGNVNDVGFGTVRRDTLWGHHTIFIDGVAGVKRVAFYHFNQATGASYAFDDNPPAIDNVSITQQPCERPYDLVASNPSMSSIDLTWHGDATATYQVAYRVQGAAASTNAYAIANGNSLTLTGLPSSTSYYWWVRKICTLTATDTLVSDFSVNGAFATQCGVVSVADTLFEDFENITGVAYNTEGDLPACWEGYNASNTLTPHVTNGSTYSYCISGTNAITLTSGTSTSYTGGVDNYLRLVDIIEPTNTLTIAFWMCTESSTNGFLEVGYLTGLNYATDFVAVKRINASSATYHSGNGLQTAGHGIFDTVSFDSVPAGNFPICFRWNYTTSYYSCCLDDIAVWSSNTCTAPAVSVSAITYQSANIIASGSSSYYELNYGTDAGNLSNSMTSINGIFNLTGLLPDTNYYYEVRKQCDSATFSNWTEGVFRTDSLPCTEPTGLQATATSYTSATLTWTGNANTYEVHVAGASDNIIQTVIGNTATITGLHANVTYMAEVRALCMDTVIMSGWSQSYQFTTDACQPVTGFNSTTTSSTATVTWTSTGSDSYTVIWGYYPFNNMNDALGQQTVSTNSCTITGLDADEDYGVFVYNNCAEGVQTLSAQYQVHTQQGGVNPTMYTINVVANNSAWGNVTGGGQYVEGSSVQITASGNPGYHFDRWNDNNTDSVRTIIVTGNATYTANFAENGSQVQYYTVTVASNNEAWGTVDGGGSYAEGSTATITANPKTGYKFVQWNDGNTSNPRSFVVTADVTYTATFAVDPNGIDDVENGSFVLAPNPASTSVTLSLAGFEGMVKVEMVDMNGRVSGNWTVTDGQLTIDLNGYAQGAYFVRVTGEQQTAVRKLIVR